MATATTRSLFARGSPLRWLIWKRWRCSSVGELEDPYIIKSPFPDLTIPNIPLHNFIWRDVDKWSDLTAIECGVTGRSYSYLQTRELCRRLAAGALDGGWWSSASSSGLKPGQVVAVLMPNTPEYPIILLGALEAGLTLTTINPMYTPDEIANQLRNSGSVCVVTVPETLGTLQEAKKKLSSLNRHQAETLKVVVAPSALTGHDPGENLPPGVVSLSSLLNEHVDPRQQFGVESRLASSVHVDASQDVAVLPYSSGTTGLPKGVCLTHHNIVSNLMQLAEPKIRNQLPTTDGHQEVVLALLPMFHIYGMVAVALQAISYGSKLVTLPKFEEKLFLKSLVEHEVTVLYLAPPLVLYLGSSPNVTKEHLKSVRVTVSGAAPIGRSDIIRCLDKSRQGNIYKQGFGLTECSPAVCCCLNNSTNYASVGPPLANTLVKVVDLTTGRSLPPNSKGEICVKGPQVMKGYLNNEVATKEAIDDQGWFHTGDIGYYDEQHLFYVVDRLKELIKVKGFQVAPAELEELLRSHAGVDDAGVIGVKDDRKGEHPVAFIKPSSISSPSEWRDLEASLRAFLKEKAADYKQIHEFVQIKMIPKSPAGKIMRKTLKEMYTPPK